MEYVDAGELGEPRERGHEYGIQLSPLALP